MTTSNSYLARPKQSLIAAFIVALSGILYELGIAFALSIILGGTYRHYGLVIGLFTLTLGTGALLFERIPKRWLELKYFIILQFIIACLALIVFFWISVFGKLLSPELPLFIIYSVLLLPVVIIGLITGLELPWLITNHRDDHQSLIIGSDYVGMFGGSLIFPLILIPYFGLIGVFFVAISANIIVACYLIASSKKISI